MTIWNIVSDLMFVVVNEQSIIILILRPVEEMISGVRKNRYEK